MNPPTTPPTATVQQSEPPQWAKDAAEEYKRAVFITNSTLTYLAAIIAKHAPTHVSDGAYVTAITARNEARQERDAARAELAETLKALRKAWETILKRPLPPAESIWRPVSVKPTPSDSDGWGYILWLRDGDHVRSGRWDSSLSLAISTHWTRTADLLAACPLPVEKTQDELDREWIMERHNRFMAGNINPEQIAAEAIAYGRATAQGGKE